MTVFVEWYTLFMDEIKMNNCKVDIWNFDSKETCKMVRIEINVKWDGLFMDEIRLNNI